MQSLLLAAWESSLVGRLLLALPDWWDDSLIGRVLNAIGRFSVAVFAGSFFGRVLLSDWPNAETAAASNVGRLLAWLNGGFARLARRVGPWVQSTWETSWFGDVLRWAVATFAPWLTTSLIGRAFLGYTDSVELAPAEAGRRADPLVRLLGVVLGLLPVLPSDWGGLLSPTTLMIIGIWGVAGVWVLRKLMTGDAVWRGSSAALPLAVLLMVAAAATVQSVSRKDSLLNFIIWTTAILCFWLMANLVRNSRDVAALLGPILVGTALMTLWAVYQQIVPPVVTEHWSDPTTFGTLVRSFAGMGNPNYLGEYMVLYLPLAVALWFPAPKRWFELGLIILLMGLGLLLTFTRGAWLAALLALGILIFMRARRWSVYMVLGGLAGIGAALALPKSLIVQRLLSAFTTQDSSNAFRLNVWQGVIAMLKQNWVLGAGLGAHAFEQLYSWFMLPGAAAAHAHNLFLQEFGEMGILGLITVVWALVAVIRRPFVTGLDSRRALVLAAVPTALIGLLLQGMVEHIWYNPKLLLAFWAVAGLGMGLALGDKEEFKEGSKA